MPKTKKKSNANQVPERLRITNYFAQNLNPSDIQKNDVQNTSTTKDFYNKCLSNQLNAEQCEIPECQHVQEKIRLEQLLAESKEKFEQTKKAKDVCERICKKKDEEIATLEKQLQMHITPTTKNSSDTLLYSKHSEQFTAKELSELRSIGGNQSEDSGFILNSIRYIYKGQMDRLTHISVTGRSRMGIKKAKMSPNKFTAIQNMFNERMNSLELTSDAQKKRAKRINLLIKDAIQNIANPKANDKQKLRELNDKINEQQNKI